MYRDKVNYSEVRDFDTSYFSTKKLSEINIQF